VPSGDNAVVWAPGSVSMLASLAIVAVEKTSITPGSPMAT
jgi:hypothetical protein